MSSSRLKLLRPFTASRQATGSSVERALAIIKDAAVGPSPGVQRGALPLTEHKPSQSAVKASVGNALQLSRGDPIHLLHNGEPQPWELMPLKAAAFKTYPNLFNTSCMFFGSLLRDVLHKRPVCLLRPTRLGIDLAKMTRNLGIIGGFEIWQRPDVALKPEQRWPPGAEPEDEVFLRLFPKCYLKLHIRWDQHRPLWMDPSAPITQQPLHTGEPLPLSITNISKASRPVMMNIEQLAEARASHPSGIFVCFHHELGLVTDAVADHYGLPAVLVLAHVGLPFSQAIQIRGAVRVKYLAEMEAGQRPVPLTKWNMLHQIQESIRRREGQMLTEVVREQEAAIQAELKKIAHEDAVLVSRSEEISEELNNERMAWLLRDRLPQLYDVQVQEKVPGTGSAATGGAPEWGSSSWR